jgi:hypothetical protein
MEELLDGTYDVVVVDASDEEDDAVHLELVLVSGPSKGQVLGLTARHLRVDATSLMGLPATLRVVNGNPSLAFD